MVRRHDVVVRRCQEVLAAAATASTGSMGPCYCIRAAASRESVAPNGRMMTVHVGQSERFGVGRARRQHRLKRVRQQTKRSGCGDICAATKGDAAQHVAQQMKRMQCSCVWAPRITGIWRATCVSNITLSHPKQNEYKTGLGAMPFRSPQACRGSSGSNAKKLTRPRRPDEIVSGGPGWLKSHSRSWRACAGGGQWTAGSGQCKRVRGSAAVWAKIWALDRPGGTACQSDP